MSQKRKICSIILAAGRGTRIGLTTTHKTCLPVGGRPVIVRSIEAYRAAGISPHVIVAGKGAQHVLKTVGSLFSDVLFAYQPQPLGTGNAARCGANVLASMAYNGDVLVAAGDKLIDGSVVKALVRKFSSSTLDCLFLVGLKDQSPGSGRVVFDDGGRPVAVVETADIRRARVLSQILLRAEAGQVFPDFVAKAIAASGIPQKKVRLAFDKLYDFGEGTVLMSQDEVKDFILKEKTYFTVPWAKRSRKLSPEQVDSAQYVNLSVYVFKFEALQFAVKKIKNDNAQGEEYVTDVIRILAGAKEKGRDKFELGTMCLKDPQRVMGFNNLEELRLIEEYVRSKQGWV